MATIYTAELTPSKKEFVTAWLDKQFWGGSGEPELVGTYRFDDTSGEVGFEGFVVKRDDRILHLPMTYRAAPLDGAEDYLITRTQHSVLGERWVYDAIDRKSTRLNSSHVSISYAVFCLKKKNIYSQVATD